MSVPQALVPNPYVGPRSFQAGEALYGRDHELRDLLGLLIAERIVLLHSPSGAGKTSLVQAALIPQLEEHEFAILPVMRVSLEPPTVTNDEGRTTNSAPDDPSVVRPSSLVGNRYVISALLSLEEALPPEQQTPLAALGALTLDAYLNQHPIAGTASSMVLIFDQFEEILTVDPTNLAAKAEFFAQVGRALRNRQRWALFSMREDYVAALTPYLPRIPTRLSCTYRLDLLGATAAQQAIRQPAQGSGVEFDPAAATRLIDDLRRVHVQRPNGSVEEQLGPTVEPVQLQVVCYRLWEQRFGGHGTGSPNGDRQITLTDVEAVGDVNSALSDYYAEQVAAIAQATEVHERTIREWFDRQLITPQGIRSQVLQNEGQSQGLDNRAIRELIDAYLVRAEKRRGATWFELAHDRLIEPIRNDNAAWSIAHLSQLQRQADLWDTRSRPDGLLLRDAALVEAEQWASDHADQLNPVEHDFLEQSRKVREIIRRARRTNRLIRALLVIASAALVGALVLYVQIRQRYQESQARLLVTEANTITSAPGSLALALLLSRAANDLFDSAETRGALLHSLSASPQLAAYLRSPLNEIWSVDFSPDGTLIAMVGCGQVGATHCMQGQIQLWDVATRQVSGQPIPAPDAARSVAFSPDGKLLATGGDDRAIRLWDVATRQSVAALDGHPSIVWSVAWSPDGKQIASASCAQDERSNPCTRGQIRVWDVATRQSIATLDAHQDAVHSVAWSPDGQLFASAGDSTIILWDAATRRQVGTLAGFAGQVSSVAFAPDNRMLASAGRDGTIHLWDVATRTARGRPLEGHLNTIYSLAWSPDGRTLASTGADSTVRVWDVATQQQRAVLLGQSNPIWHVAFNRDGRTLASSSFALVTLWDLDARQRLGQMLLGPEAHPLISAARSADGQRLATVGCAAGLDQQTLGCQRAEVRLWDLASRQPLGAPLGGANDLSQVVGFSPDGKLLAAGGCAPGERASPCVRGAIQLWDLATRQQIGTLSGHQATITSLAWSPDGKLLASGSADRTIIIWDAATRHPLATFDGQAGIVRSLAWSPDGSTLAAAGCAQDDRAAECTQGQIRLWNAATQKPLDPPTLGSTSPDTPYEGHTRTVRSLAWSPDGKLLASGGDDHAVIVWDLATRKQLNQQSHANSVTTVAWSPDGRVLASGSADDTIMLWSWDASASKLQRIGALSGHTESVIGVSFGPDGATLASAGLDGAIVLWDTDLRSWQTRACQLAGRNLSADEWDENLPGIIYRNVCPDVPN